MVIDTGVFTPFVENMDRSLAFYHDVFGMEVPPMPESGGRPYNNPNPRLFAFFDIMGAKERHQSARVRGIRTGVEPMEIQGVSSRRFSCASRIPATLRSCSWSATSMPRWRGSSRRGACRHPRRRSRSSSPTAREPC